MHYSTVAFTALALGIPSALGHGYVSGVVSGGKWYPGADPVWYYDVANKQGYPAQAGWYAYNQDIGFVPPTSLQNPDIICHKNATPGSTYIPVAAGSTLTLQWTPVWPASHKGPVIDYLASCNGPCTTVDKTKLQFQKLDAGGLVNDNPIPGTWASDQLIASNSSWSVKIPASLKAGNYVLRHEIIALHGGETLNGAQLYPQCLNLQVTGSGTTALPATGTLGTALYKNTDPGILFNIYVAITSYPIPGPAVWAGFAAKAKRFFNA